MKTAQIAQLSSSSTPPSSGTDCPSLLTYDCLYSTVTQNYPTTKLKGPDDGVLVLYGAA